MSQLGQPICLLSLDGGGVRGLSELVILQQLMLGVQKQRKLPAPPKPCEVFDMIGGTSTGGLVAIMLGRLKMSVEEVIDEYCNVSKEVFGQPKRLVSEGIYSASKLQQVVKNTIERYGSPKGANGRASEELKLLEEGGGTANCKVFVTSRNARAMDIVRLFRSYRSYTAGDYEGMTIWQAARATTAAPTFFKRLKIGAQYAQEEFLDGGLGSNNPTKLLMEEIVTTLDQKCPVACIISIGTGKPKIIEFKTPGLFQKTLPTDLINALKNMTTDCETVEREVRQRFSTNPGIYFRFNVEHGLENVSLEEWKELGNVKAKTIAYLGDHKIAGSVNEAVLALCNRSPRLTVSDLKFVYPLAPRTSQGKKSLRSEPVCVVPFSQRISYFMGRTDLLQQLRNCFNREDQDPLRSVIIVLRAMGGQGKTQVALEYCRRARSENYDYILWANAENQSSLEQSFLQFAKVLERSQDRDKPGSQHGRAESLSPLESVQERLSGSRYLLVIDNIDEPAKVGNIKAYMELGGKGNIIITSRHLHSEQLGTPIPIPPFSQEESHDLLSLRSGRGKYIDSDSDTKELIAALGGLPLGLDQTAAYIRETNLSYRQFLRKFQEAREILLDQDLPEFWEYKRAVQDVGAESEQQRKLGIQTAWELSLDYLKSRPDGPSKCHLLTLSAYLDSKNISQALFTPWFKLVDNAFSKGTTSNDSSPENSPTIRTEESVLVYSIAWARPLLQDLDQNSQAFFKFIQDACKIGLVSAMHHDETGGFSYSIHPLVSRWLRSRRDKDHILEAIFVAFHLVRDLNKTANRTDLYYEACRHVLACINSNDDLPENLRLGFGDLRQIGLMFCYFDDDTDDISEAQFNILRAALSHEEREYLSLASEDPPRRIILATMGEAKLKMGEYKEARNLLLRAKSLTPIWMLEFSVILLQRLISIYVKQQDEHSLKCVYVDLVKSLESLCPSSIDSRRLNPHEWISWLYVTTFAFHPQYNLSVVALSNFLTLLDQHLTFVESEELRTIRLILEYYLGLSYFGAVQFRAAQNSFVSLLQKTAKLAYSDSVLFVRLGSSFFNGVAQCLIAGTDPANVHCETVQQVSKALILNDSSKAILENVETLLKLTIHEVLEAPSGTVLKVNLILHNILIRYRDRAGGPAGLKDISYRLTSPLISYRDSAGGPAGLKAISSRMTSAVMTRTLKPELLQEAEALFNSVIELLGHCRKTECLQSLVIIGNWIHGNFERVLCMCREQIHRDAAVNQTMDSYFVRLAGRCYLRLGRLDDLEKHKQQYADEDWDLLQQEEENHIRAEGYGRAAPTNV